MGARLLHTQVKTSVRYQAGHAHGTMTDTHGVEMNADTESYR